MRLVAGFPVRPFKLTDVNIGNTLRLQVTSLDFESEQEAPASMRYRIDNLTNLRVIQDWTDVPAPADVTTIEISAATNVMSYQYNDWQLNQVTIEATYADGTKALWVGAYRLNAVYTALVLGVVP